MTGSHAEESDLLNLKRSICAVEILRLRLGLYWGLIGIPLMFALACADRASPGARLLGGLVAVGGLLVGSALGFGRARRALREALSKPGWYAAAYVIYLTDAPWYRRARRYYLGAFAPSSWTATALGVSLETYTRWYHKWWRREFLTPWAPLIYVVYGGLWFGLLATVFPDPYAHGPLAGATWFSALIALQAGSEFGFAVCWARRYRPMLERQTGLSVVEVMREFGYRPARLIGWRRMPASHE